MKYVSLDVVSDPIMCEARVLLVVVLWYDAIGCMWSVAVVAVEQ